MQYTTKEIAEKLGVSKSTARRYLQKIEAVPDESVHEADHGAVTYRYDESVLEDINALLKGKTENTGSVHKKGEPVHEADHESVSESVYETLLAQLEAKDKQIESLQKALDQEQQLHAMAENRLKLIEDKAEQETPAPDSEGRKSLWSRIKQVFTG